MSSMSVDKTKYNLWAQSVLSQVFSYVTSQIMVLKT